MNRRVAETVPALETVLIARPAPCPRCGGRGTLPAISCTFCGLFDRGAWYDPADMDGTAFPCGHRIDFLSLQSGAFACPDCEDGQVETWKTAEAWARQDVKDARQRKQAASEGARVLREYGHCGGYSGRAIRRLLRLLTPRCDAHCRTTGLPCESPVVLGAVRCRLHGGLSTGPVTAEGRARISDSNRRRAGRETSCRMNLS